MTWVIRSRMSTFTEVAPSPPQVTCTVREVHSSGAFARVTSMPHRPFGTSGVKCTDRIRLYAVDSSHTLCQMPEEGVYQQPMSPRFQYCLPRGRVLHGRSSTRRQISVLLPLSQGVMSTSKGAYPPVCSVTICPFTKTRATSSTAPKCKIRCSPGSILGMSIRYLYQMIG